MAASGSEPLMLFMKADIVVKLTVLVVGTWILLQTDGYQIICQFHRLLILLCVAYEVDDIEHFSRVATREAE